MPHMTTETSITMQTSDLREYTLRVYAQILREVPMFRSLSEEEQATLKLKLIESCDYYISHH